MQITSHSGKLALLAALFSSAALAQPAMAAGSTCQAPPGTSAIEQYCEALPTAGGSGSGHHHGPPKLPGSTTRALEQQGAAGRGVLDLTSSTGGAGGTAPASKHRHSRHHSAAAAGKSAQDTSAAPARGSNPLSAVGSSIGTGLSTGAALLWLLVAIAVVMGVTAYIDYRRRSSHG